MPVSKTEWVARELFRHYFPSLRQQHNVRPDWLTNTKTGRRLELDILFPDINVAVEISGVQHGRYIKGMQRDFQAFVDQQQRDRDKIERVKQRGVTLYQLTSFDLNQRRFEPWLAQFCATHGLTINRLKSPPLELFGKAELLSRMKVVKKRYRKPGLWPLLQRLVSRHVVPSR